MYVCCCLFIVAQALLIYFFFFNYTPTTEIYTLSLHDALPIYTGYEFSSKGQKILFWGDIVHALRVQLQHPDRKSTRLNSSHANISYAVFCLKKKTNWRRLRAQREWQRQYQRYGNNASRK